ncbi:MaoC family dehydratase [Pontibacter sp. G13]|uniref:MaoC family dehydratase n=1 Tax=Pontibacter sp. G13 TaxID=3074898 RepID=UPI00288BBB8E|nr:MaoC family dehydratase [Pontibacter sp. G13]WNJ21364.1 MaoC family dehydratase [Pontibacter sp. G13]
MQFSTLESLDSHIGQSLGFTEWLTITQEMVMDFAKATGDFQWIHVDPQRALQESPFGGPIAHGFLTLSLSAKFLEDLVQVDSVEMGMNYGLNKVRFTEVVPVGSEIRMEATLSNSEPFQQKGRKLTLSCVFSRKDLEKPVCIAEFLVLMFES